MSKTADFFNGLNERAKNGEFASQAGHVFQFVIEGAGTWTLDLKDSNSVSNESTDSADCTVETDSATFGSDARRPNGCDECIHERYIEGGQLDVGDATCNNSSDNRNFI